MQLYCGTSGYSYKEWKGPFYPKELPGKEMLRYYSARLPAVEINNTFYRMPSAAILEAWSGQVPERFRFVLKAPRAITHAKPLRNKAAEIEYFYKAAAVLGERLGAVLFQLPPYLHRDLSLLTDFVAGLPPVGRVVFEFRHPSWFDDSVYTLLRDRHAALCCSDTGDDALLRLERISDWGYLRLRRTEYPLPALRNWVARIEAPNWRTVYVFFKHEDAGTGPQLARQFIELASGPGGSG